MLVIVVLVHTHGHEHKVRNFFARNGRLALEALWPAIADDA